MNRVKQAVLLAAGRGSRMGDLCAERPKALLDVGASTLLDWNLRALVAAGVERLCVVSGWQASRLEAALRSHPLREHIEIESRCNPRWAESGPVSSLLLADDWLQRAPTLMLYSDCAYAPRTLAAISNHYRGELLVPGDRLWSALWTLRFEQPLLDAERWRSRDGKLLEIGGHAGALDTESAQFMGLLAFDPSAWVPLRADIARWRSDDPNGVERLDITAMLSRCLHEGALLRCMEVEGGWFEIDSEEDHRRISAAMRLADAQHSLWSHDVRGA